MVEVDETHHGLFRLIRWILTQADPQNTPCLQFSLFLSQQLPAAATSWFGGAVASEGGA